MPTAGTWKVPFKGKYRVFQKKTNKGFLGKTECYCPKLLSNFKISCISKSFKKNIIQVIKKKSYRLFNINKTKKSLI